MEERNRARVVPLLSLSILLGGVLWYWSFLRRQSAKPNVPPPPVQTDDELDTLRIEDVQLVADEGPPLREEPAPRLVRPHGDDLFSLPKPPVLTRQNSGWTDGQDDGQDVLSLMCRTSIIREPNSVARERPAPVTTVSVQEPEFHEVNIRFKNQTFNVEDSTVATGLRHALTLRRKRYALNCPELELKSCRAEMRQGIVCLVHEDGTPYYPRPSLSVFAKDLEELWVLAKDGPARTCCFRRLDLLSKMGELHSLINKENEAKGTLNNSQDFYQVPKVDNHIHASAMMTARHLLQFIVDKLDYEPEAVVLRHEGQDCTLAQVFAKRGLNRENLSVDDLKVQGCCSSMFHRFDRFNNSYNPFGDSVLRDLFLKTNNFTQGKYFAQLCNQVVDYLEVCDNNVYIEPRLSIYGESKNEWFQLALWFQAHRLNRKYVLWMVQIPRVFHIFRKRGTLRTFEQYLDNIFSPMFAATLDPTLHPEVAELLSCLVGMDSVDDESVEDHLPPGDVSPEVYDSLKNPTYSYYLFHSWANLQSLNALRRARGLNTIAFRPHSGEAGPVHHLATTFLLAQSINHGIRVKENPTLQYLYYLAEVGMSISPLSNNVLFVELERNPFPVFFRQGLNVTLSTDDPLQFHTTREALVEEYTIAKQLWRLSSTDLSEIARNSVMQSGLTHEGKLKLLGPNYDQTDGFNDPKYTNIPDCRVRHRRACKFNEHKFVWQASGELQEAAPLHWHGLCSKA